ncbi:hypothetical protein M8C13_32435 [Crossiella sp. SN42]|uniref:hypothetical protein n=1 Tax=Crossiella sp. SN42 TaxID=2944808 RepID=UPI00207C8CF2|nr:hypothetical protein [Crossiella sp. SN42]MCO1580472.1 hypothetical protein [Crossiella sp. SN42]
MAAMFAQQDHVFGGTPSVQTVLAQLQASDLLRTGNMTETTRIQLFSALGELADTAAGICFDAGSRSHAARCFHLAVARATDAQDWALRAKGLSGLANLTLHQAAVKEDQGGAETEVRRAYDDALSFAEHALVRADRLDPVVQAVVHTRHARALGSLGKERQADCLAAIGRAEDAFAARHGDEPGWISYYNASRLERDCGRALLGLAMGGGDPTRAHHYLSSSISAFPTGQPRGKALAVANLAALTMAHGDPDRATALGNEVLDTVGATGQVRSDRVVQALGQLRRAALRHLQQPGVRELRSRISKLRAGTSTRG